MANTDPYEMHKQMNELVHSTKTLVSLVAQLAGGIKKIAGEAEDVADATEEAKKNVVGMAKAIKSIAYNKIITTCKAVSVSSKEIRDMQAKTGANLKQWNKMFKNMTTSAREINQSLNKAAFNSKDFLEAANKLASIGWSELSSLSKITPALAKINKAVGETTASFNKSILDLQRVFKDGTAQLVEGLGNQLSSYSKLMGVTAEDIENAMAKMTAQVNRISNGNAEVASQLYENLTKAVSLGGQMGLDKSSVESLMYKVANASADEIASLAQAFGMSGQSALDMQSMAAGGQYYEAMQALIKGVGASQTGNTMLDNIYKSTFAQLGMSADAVDNIVANMGNIETYLKNIQDASEATSGALDGRIGEQLVSLPDRINNMLSNSSIAQGLTQMASTLGIGSVSDAAKTVEAVKSIIPKGAIDALFTNEKGERGLNMEMFGKMGKFAAIAAIAAPVLQRLFQNESLQNAIKKVQDVLSGLVDSLGGIIDAIAGVIANVVDKLANILSDIITALSPVFDIVISLVQLIGNILTELTDFLSGIINSIMDPLTNVISAILGAITSILNVVVPIVQTVVTVISNLAKILMPVMTVIIRVVSLVLDTVGGIISKIIGNIASTFDALAPIINVVLDMVSGVFEVLGSVFEMISGVIDALFDVLDPIMKMIIDLLTPLLAPMTFFLKAFTKLIEPMLQPFVKVVQALSSVIKFIGPVVNMVMQIFSPIITGLQAIGNWLADISIFGWHPFDFLRSDASVAPPAEITEEQYKQVTEATTQSEYDSTAGGMVYRYGLTNSGFHTGDDIPMAVGTPLSAAQAGIITSQGYNNTYGNYLSMLGTDGIQRVFGHLNSSDVSTGDFVMPGQALGTSGNSGNSNEPHVHYETRENGRFIDPALVAKSGGSNADIVKAIQWMTARLENKLEEVSQRTEENEKWIKEFDKKSREAKFNY